MAPTDRHEWMGLLSGVEPERLSGDISPRRGAKRNGWVVVGFFALVIASWISSLV